MVLFATLFSRQSAVSHSPNLIPLHSYRELLNGGTRELLRTNFMNVILFYPGGLLLRMLLPSGRRAVPAWIGTGLLLGCFSLGLEYLQYRLALGTPEIDDVIHNTLGALLGWLCFHSFLKIAE